MKKILNKLFEHQKLSREEAYETLTEITRGEVNEAQIAAFLTVHPEFARAPITAGEVFGHDEWITPEGDLRTLPFHLEGGMDGFYAARLRKI